MELHIFETAVRLANELGRTLVVPRLPQLETNTYERGLDDYFEMPQKARMVSHTEYVERTGGVIGMHVQIIPEYRPEFRSEINRAWHPVWLRNIDESPYFGIVGCEVEHSRVQVVRTELTALEAAELFDFDHESLAISYLNGLLIDAPGAVPVANDDFNGRVYTPPRPRQEYFDRAIEWAQGQSFDAVHIREGYRQLAWDVSGVRIPLVEDFIDNLDSDPLVYVATDVEKVFDHVLAARPRSGHARRGDEQIGDVATDMAACISAELFIGTHFSTFSQYISHARRLSGKHESETILVRDDEHAADHVYKTYDFGGGLG